MVEQSIGQWLRQRLDREGLSLRKAAAKTGVSHAAIRGILRGASPAAETVRKLAQGFSGNDGQRVALEDYLLTLAGYRSERPEAPRPAYLKVASLLSPERQHILKVLVRDFARIEGIDEKLLQEEERNETRGLNQLDRLANQGSS